MSKRSPDRSKALGLISNTIKKGKREKNVRGSKLEQPVKCSNCLAFSVSSFLRSISYMTVSRGVNQKLLSCWVNLRYPFM